VEKIAEQAKKYHTDYLNAVQRLDLEARIRDLEANKKKQEAVKATDAYDEARIKSFAAALGLEIDNLKKRLATIPGDGKVKAPPALWGVLSQYHGFAMPVPHIFAPMPVAAGEGGKGDLVYDAAWLYHSAYRAPQAPAPVKLVVPSQAESDGPVDISPLDDSDLLYATRPPAGSAVSNFVPGVSTAPSAVAELYAGAGELPAAPPAAGSGSGSGSGSSAALLETVARTPDGRPLRLHAMPPPPPLPHLPPPPQI
jgi:hypothetical protein